MGRPVPPRGCCGSGDGRPTLKRLLYGVWVEDELLVGSDALTFACSSPVLGAAGEQETADEMKAVAAKVSRWNAVQHGGPAPDSLWSWGPFTRRPETFAIELQGRGAHVDWAIQDNPATLVVSWRRFPWPWERTQDNTDVELGMQIDEQIAFPLNPEAMAKLYYEK